MIEASYPLILLCAFLALVIAAGPMLVVNGGIMPVGLKLC